MTDAEGILPVMLLMPLVLLAPAPISGVPAHAAGGTQCTFEIDIVASPGLSTSPTLRQPAFLRHARP